MAGNSGATSTGFGRMINDEDLDTVVKSDGMAPTEQQARDCYSGLSLLRRTLLGEPLTRVAEDLPHTFMSTVQGVTLIFSDIGAYCLGCWDPSATIVCSMAGTPSDDTFFDMALQKLRRNQDIILSAIDESGPFMFRVSINEVVFSIQYHQTPFTASWACLSRGGLEESVSLAPIAKRRFNAYRDTLHLRSVVPNHDAFNRAYLAIKLWAQRHGIFSEAFGFLDETTLLFMVAEASCHRDTLSSKSYARIVLKFFEYFNSKDLTNFVIGDIIPRGEKTEARSESAHGIIIRSFYSPCHNISNVKTVAHARIIQREITNSMVLLQDKWNLETLFGNAQYPEFSRPSANPSPKHETQATSTTLSYANNAVAYIKIEAAHWGASIIEKGRYFESIDVIVAEFARKLALKENPDLFFRPWPVRLQRRRDANTNMSEPYHCAYYLIGLHTKSTLLPSATNFASSQTPFVATLHNDIADLQTSFSSMKLDTSSSFFAVNIVTQAQLDDDHFETDRSFGPIPLDEAELDDLEDEIPVSEELQAVKPKAKRASKSKKGDFGETAAQANVPRSRLRPALDILNRLRFDGKYAVDDYVIGYEDRHAGIMEMPVTSWKASDSTLEEFIPQSRIVYYKRKGDGVEVWNRRTRLDTIFGSGARQRAE